MSTKHDLHSCLFLGMQSVIASSCSAGFSASLVESKIFLSFYPDALLNFAFNQLWEKDGRRQERPLNSLVDQPLSQFCGAASGHYRNLSYSCITE
jgi:hypothetical protein